MTSPGFWIASITGYLSWALSRGSIFSNHVIASSHCRPPIDFGHFKSSFGHVFGRNAQRLYPWIKAFQADVPKGSLNYDLNTWDFEKFYSLDEYRCQTGPVPLQTNGKVVASFRLRIEKDHLRTFLAIRNLPKSFFACCAPQNLNRKCTKANHPEIFWVKKKDASKWVLNLRSKGWKDLPLCHSYNACNISFWFSPSNHHHLLRIWTSDFDIFWVI